MSVSRFGGFGDLQKLGFAKVGAEDLKTDGKVFAIV
jgi:hypothetical protein